MKKTKKRHPVARQTEKRHPEQPRKCCEGTQTKLCIQRESCFEDQKQEQLAKLVRGGSVCLSLIILLVLLAGCASSTGATKQDSKTGATTLTAVKTEDAPVIDGKISEDVWAKAKPVTVGLEAEAGVEPEKITLKALYDNENVYLSAVYADSTPLKIGEAWGYDGATWSKGVYDDTLGLVWNIGDSLPVFDTKGLDVMTTPLKNGLDVYDFKIDNPSASLAKGRLDVWGWCGMPEFYGKADDMIFKQSAKPGEKALTVQHDAYTNGKPWIKNETTIDGKPAPLYKYKQGLTLENTPRPYMEDMEAIADYTAFKAGDRAPYVVGIKGVVWGGSKDDIITKGVNDNRSWTVEFARARDTGYSDDVTLIPGEETTFAVIIRDDGKGYALSGPVILKFE